MLLRVGGAPLGVEIDLSDATGNEDDRDEGGKWSGVFMGRITKTTGWKSW